MSEVPLEQRRLQEWLLHFFMLRQSLIVWKDDDIHLHTPSRGTLKSTDRWIDSVQVLLQIVLCGAARVEELIRV